MTPSAAGTGRKGSPASLRIAGELVRAGESRDLGLKISETYMGMPIEIPLRVIRAPQAGPTVALVGALHGDELNGIGIIRDIMFKDLQLRRGTLVCLPVVNIFGLENQSRYLPDRRDLNRSFPGREQGSLAFRLAHALFQDVILQCDYCIDLHTAAAKRTNFPHVRGDLSRPDVKRLAYAFGCELVVHKKGSLHTLRATACRHGVPTIIYEAGEVLKFEPGIIGLGVRGILNVLKSLEMIEGEPVEPVYQTRVRKTLWVRADTGGILRYRVKPGELVEAGEPLAVCDKIFSQEGTEIVAPVSGIVLGMSTMPAIKPGEPVCHLAVPSASLASIRSQLQKQPESLHRRLQRDLATSFSVEGSEKP